MPANGVWSALLTKAPASIVTYTEPAGTCTRGNEMLTVGPVTLTKEDSAATVLSTCPVPARRSSTSLAACASTSAPNVTATLDSGWTLVAPLLGAKEEAVGAPSAEVSAIAANTAHEIARMASGDALGSKRRVCCTLRLCALKRLLESKAWSVTDSLGQQECEGGAEGWAAREKNCTTSDPTPGRPK